MFHNSWSRALACSPDGKRLAVGSNDQRISLWDTAEHKLLDNSHGHKAMVTALAFADDGKTLFSSSTPCRKGAAALGVGSSLVNQNLLDTSDLDELTRRAAAFIGEVNKAREK